MRVVGPTIWCLTLSAVGAAYIDHPRATPPRAMTAPSCPLPINRQLKAVKAFAAMLPVFRHPRCRNCHGALDLFSDQHPGAGQLDESMDPTQPMAPDIRADSFAVQCADCHDNIRRMDHPSGKGGWTTPPPPMFFVDERGKDKSDEDLCIQMKAQETTGESFVSHIRDDHETIQFIEAGFFGDRALGPEGLSEHKLVREPPPGTQAGLTAKAQEWVDILGEGYQASKECGCVKPRIRLEVHHRFADNTTDGATRAGIVDFAGDVKFEVTLEPADTMGIIWYSGDTVVTRRMTMTSARKGCRGEGVQDEEWELSTILGQEAEKIELRVRMYASERGGSATCPGAASPMEVYPTVRSRLPVLVLPLDSGSVAQATAQIESFGGGTAQEWVTLRILDAP